MDYYNREKLVKVTVNGAFPARYFTYKKEKRIMGFITRKAGYYNTLLWDDEWIGTEIPEYHQVINGKLYEKPEVILHFQNGHSKTYYFDTYRQAEKFAIRIMGNGHFIS